MTRIAFIVGSTRPGRKADVVVRWLDKLASRRDDASYDVLDLAEIDLPHLDEPVPAAMGQDYANEHTSRWAELVDSYDGYVFITPEYNHGTTGVLKNALDFLYQEWHNKSAGFVGYGLVGGVRAVEQLRLVVAELHIASVRDQVTLSLFTDFDGEGNLTPAPHHEQAAHKMLDEVVAWADALAPLRAKENATA